LNHKKSIDNFCFNNDDINSIQDIQGINDLNYFNKFKELNKNIFDNLDTKDTNTEKKIDINTMNLKEDLKAVRFF
jgi:hypothetical protein